jgi:hypothetical protein
VDVDENEITLLQQPQELPEVDEEEAEAEQQHTPPPKKAVPVFPPPVQSFRFPRAYRRRKACEQRKKDAQLAARAAQTKHTQPGGSAGLPFNRAQRRALRSAAWRDLPAPLRRVLKQGERLRCQRCGRLFLTNTYQRCECPAIVWHKAFRAYLQEQFHQALANAMVTDEGRVELALEHVQPMPTGVISESGV